MLSFSKKHMSSSIKRLSLINSHLMSTSSTSPKLSDEIKCQVKGLSRIITLDRPSKLNALNTSMVNDITSRLLEFNKSTSANMIILNSSTPKAFCSGGDIIQCTIDNLNQKPESSIEFFTKEYNLNYLLSTISLPVVSICNGITMGGGVGLSVHNPFRIVTDSTKFAMPESNIGFFSDVGTSFWLPKLDANLGFYLALTGDIVQGKDNLITGFGTHYVPESKLTNLIERLSNLETKDLKIINSTIEEFSDEIPQDHKFKYSVEELNTIEKCFDPYTHKNFSSIVESLKEDGSPFALETVEKLSTKSLLSLELIFQLLRKNSNTEIKSAIQSELTLASKMMLGYQKNDFNEFITKNLINRKATDPNDKIPNPVFKELKDIDAELVSKLLDSQTSSPDFESLTLPKQEKEDGTIDTAKLLDEASDLLNSAKIDTLDPANAVIDTYQDYLHNFGLPTEYEIECYIKGDDGSSRQFSVTAKETLNYFNQQYKSRHGVNYKVEFVMQRKCKPSEFDAKYLEWID